MIDIDGSFGEGGGQIIRTSLALSAVTNKAFRIKNIRAKRPKPGIQNQHLTAIKAAAQTCAADLDGAELHSTSLEFNPNQIEAGNYFFDIGTAGSTTLVLQTILYGLLWRTNSNSTAIIKGGTHNPFAPSYDFLKASFIPALYQFGLDLNLELKSYGFYPRGGGEIHATIIPNQNLEPIELTAEIEVDSVKAAILIAGLPEHIVKREETVLRKQIRTLSEIKVDSVKALSPGNAIHIFAGKDKVTETFCQLGKRGKKAETVAEEVCVQFNRYKNSSAMIGEHLADQLLIPMALAGKGKFTTTKPSDHTLTNIETIRHFLDVNITISTISENLFMVECSS